MGAIEPASLTRMWTAAAVAAARHRAQQAVPDAGDRQRTTYPARGTRSRHQGRLSAMATACAAAYNIETSPRARPNYLAAALVPRPTLMLARPAPK
jgi:hypothetical protein